MCILIYLTYDTTIRAGATGGVLGVQTPTASCFIILYNMYPSINGHPLSGKSLLGYPLLIKHGAGHDYHQKMMTHHSVMTSSLRIRILKIENFGDFSCNIDYNCRTDHRDVSPFILINVSPGGRRAPAYTKCLPASQGKQAKRACSHDFRIINYIT